MEQTQTYIHTAIKILKLRNKSCWLSVGISPVFQFFPGFFFFFWMGKGRDDLMAKNRAYAKLNIDTNSRQLPLKGFIRKGKEFYITSKGKEYEFVETFVSVR